MAYSLKYSYNSSTNSYSVTGYSNIRESDIVVIPDTYDDGTNGSHPVTSIAERAFEGGTRLTNITIPNSVKSIRFSAFAGCRNLPSITIPDSVTSIEGYAFWSCYNLMSVNIPDSVISIGNAAFYECSSLTSVTIGNSVTSIGSSAFYNCNSLKQIILFPSQPPTLGGNAMPSKVQTIYVLRESNEAYKNATNWTALSSKIVSNNLYLSFVRFNAKNKEYIDKKVDNDTDRIRCGDLYVAGELGLIQAKQIQNPARGDGVTVNDSLKVLIEPSQDNDVVRKKELDSKLDKSGGIISGSLTISNDLIVQGITVTVDTQNLKVADKLIYVAKDNTIPLTSPAGLITPKYDGTNNGGIVYDSTGTAYVGDIALDSNGNIDTANSDLQPIATRDNNNNLINGNLLIWDSANKKIIDSGINSNSVATNLQDYVDDALLGG